MSLGGDTLECSQGDFSDTLDTACCSPIKMMSGNMVGIVIDDWTLSGHSVL